MVVCEHFNRPSVLIEVRKSVKVIHGSLFSLRVISREPALLRCCATDLIYLSYALYNW